MKTLSLENITLNNKKAKICIPITGKTREEILSQTERIIIEKPDIVEWRVDYYNTDYQTGNSSDEYVEILEDIHYILKNIPIIITFRTKVEGGEKDIDFDLYERYLIELAKEGPQNNVEFIDVEGFFYKDKAKILMENIKKKQVKVIASHHNFKRTPNRNEIVRKLKELEEIGGDICKMAVMPECKEDVDEMIIASRMADNELNVPIITMSMGELGAVTRVCTEMTGSVLTFAASGKCSAPGQLQCCVLKEIKKLKKDFPKPYNIIFVGFMGTGKTTVSKALSRILNVEEIDSDQYIVEKEGMTVAEIFETKGENYFRDLETKALKELQQTKGKIISCGGGAVIRDENVDILKEDGVIIQLYGTPETIFERVRRNSNRPVLNDDMSIEYVTELMSKRRPRYDEIADFSVAIDDNDRVMTCYEILKYLKTI